MIQLGLKNLSVARAGRPILRGVDLDVAGGELVGIIGPNGAGKSTLVKAALGLLPATGDIAIVGKPMPALTTLERARAAAYIPQDREVAWDMPVRDVVMLGRLPHRAPFAAPTEQDVAAVTAAMDDADVSAFADRPVTALSGGERARVLVARALAQQAPLLLADEPTSGLDPAQQLAIMALFRAACRQSQAIVLTIHDLQLAGRWCDRLVLLHDGRVVGSGPPLEVLTPAAIRVVYGCDARIIDSPDGPVIATMPLGI
ncbi:MAG: ABC transporter ATP-binding protein [Hyphomicrobiaceae bacterium]|nr:ABC transporter ATP-binding protein [Hyphomicrobiaceae bacterium]